MCLPDFRLQHAQVYLEIKRSAPTMREATLVGELAAGAAAENWRYGCWQGTSHANRIVIRMDCSASAACPRCLNTSW
jgi:hypothetical protein